MVKLHDRALASVRPPVEVEADRVVAAGLRATELHEPGGEQRRLEEPVSEHRDYQSLGMAVAGQACSRSMSGGRD